MLIIDLSSDVCSSDLGDYPAFVILAFARGEALFDRVLVAARESGVDKLAAIGVARMDGQIVAIFDRLDDLVDVREVEAGINALRVHVERDGDEAGVAGVSAVAEQSARHALARREPGQPGP